MNITYMVLLSLGIWGSIDASVTHAFTSYDCSQVSLSLLLDSRYIKVYAKGNAVLENGKNRTTMYEGVMFHSDFSDGPPFFGEGTLSRSISSGGSFSWPYKHVINVGDTNYVTLYYQEGDFVSYLKPQDNRCFVLKGGKEIIFYTGSYMPEGSHTRIASGGFIESWLVRITGYGRYSGENKDQMP